jgi:predicted nucleic acid-binding protein
MNVFIDTNILLDFFRLSRGDLEEIHKIIGLWKYQRLNLLISDHLKDEFYRNREKVIAESLATFEKSIFVLHRPNLVRVHVETKKLEHLQNKFEQLRKSIIEKVVQESQSRKTKADCVIAELFATAHVPRIDNAIIEKGLRRCALGKPPGKTNSCGDAIHWEWLMAAVKHGEDLYIVSGDGDFESHLYKGVLAEYLANEWASNKQSKCHLFVSLSDFLRAHFPSVRFADEDKKIAAIRRLERARSIGAAKNAIVRLMNYEDFSKIQLSRLINALKSNYYIFWGIDDRAAFKFASKVIQIATETGLGQEVLPIERMLKELEYGVEET